MGCLTLSPFHPLLGDMSVLLLDAVGIIAALDRGLGQGWWLSGRRRFGEGFSGGSVLWLDRLDRRDFAAAFFEDGCHFIARDLGATAELIKSIEQSSRLLFIVAASVRDNPNGCRFGQRAPHLASRFGRSAFGGDFRLNPAPIAIGAVKGRKDGGSRGLSIDFHSRLLVSQALGPSESVVGSLSA